MIETIVSKVYPILLAFSIFVCVIWTIDNCRIIYNAVCKLRQGKDRVVYISLIVLAIFAICVIDLLAAAVAVKMWPY